MTKNTNELTTGVTWVLVADASRAEIYSRKKRRSPLEPVQSLDEPEARSREGDLVSDSRGRSFDSGGEGRHAMEPDQSVKDHLLVSFANRIADVLESGRSADRYQHLVIIAAPALLGELRARISGTTRALVSAEFDKHMTGQAPADIAALIDV